MAVKKVAVMIYPNFSMQEISCLTDALTVWYGIKIDVFASSKEIMLSEDGFQIIANKVFEDFIVEDYSCLIMPGIIDPLPALFNEKNINFLSCLKGKDIIIAAISSAPMLLAKAGILDNISYTSGIWEEINQYLDFIPSVNNLHKPLVHDKNIITAIGFAFREFAAETLQALGLECEKNIFGSIQREYSKEELTFSMGEENFKEFLKEYSEYKK